MEDKFDIFGGTPETIEDKWFENIETFEGNDGTAVSTLQGEYAIMTRISVEEAQAKLPEIIHQMSPGEEFVITENDVVIARLVGAPTPQQDRKLGSMQGTVLYMDPDFDAPLDDFAEYTK